MVAVIAKYLGPTYVYIFVRIPLLGPRKRENWAPLHVVMA